MREEPEVTNAVLSINQDIYIMLDGSSKYENFDLNDQLPELTYSYNGFAWCVEFLGFSIFCSENDSLEYNEELDVYSETYEERFRKEMRKILKNLNNLKDF